MFLRDVLSLTQSQLLSPDPTTLAAQGVFEREVKSAFGADLMSDVLCYQSLQGLLITGLINPQSVRTAEMAEMTAILIVRGKTPSPEMLAVAEQVGIPVMGTKLTMFETCGRLYHAGLVAARRYDDTIECGCDE
jgi:predicted transcriptional regulator